MAEIVADGTEFGSDEWYEARWNSLSSEQQQKAIAVCKRIVSPKDFESIRRKQAEYGHQWIHHLIDLSDEDQKDFQEMGLSGEKQTTMSAHHIWGTNIRNQLRHGVCSDEDLPLAPYPDGESYSNWDDYYCQALEAAAKIGS